MLTKIAELWKMFWLYLFIASFKSEQEVDEFIEFLIEKETKQHKH